MENAKKLISEWKPFFMGPLWALVVAVVHTLLVFLYDMYFDVFTDYVQDDYGKFLAETFFFVLLAVIVLFIPFSLIYHFICRKNNIEPRLGDYAIYFAIFFALLDVISFVFMQFFYDRSLLIYLISVLLMFIGGQIIAIKTSKEKQLR